MPIRLKETHVLQLDVLNTVEVEEIIESRSCHVLFCTLKALRGVATCIAGAYQTQLSFLSQVHSVHRMKLRVTESEQQPPSLKLFQACV